MPAIPERERGKSQGPPDRRLAAPAADQHGVVDLRDLREVGISERAAQGRVASARLHRVHRGVYAVGHPRLTPDARRLGLDDRAVMRAIPVTSLARTLVDLAEVLAADRLERVLDHAGRHEAFDRRAVEAALDRLPGRWRSTRSSRASA